MSQRHPKPYLRLLGLRVEAFDGPAPIDTLTNCPIYEEFAYLNNFEMVNDNDVDHHSAT